MFSAAVQVEPAHEAAGGATLKLQATARGLEDVLEATALQIELQQDFGLSAQCFGLDDLKPFKLSRPEAPGTSETRRFACIFDSFLRFF